MAQALTETIFDVCYLAFVIAIGAVMAFRSRGNRLIRQFGLMAILLGVGDSFHLVPRMIALWGEGLEANAAWLGIGKLITSITMTAFYLLLYYIWRERYGVRGRRGLTGLILGLALLRVALCALPQNDWLSYRQPLIWGILRNIPFCAMGILIILLFAREAGGNKDKVFRFMPLAAALSFAFYIPVVLAGSSIPLLGMLMIPKTLAYVWMVLMGWRLYRQRGFSSKI